MNIAIPLLACRAQHINVLALNHLQMINALLTTNCEHKIWTKQDVLQISIEECKQMLQLKDIASHICDDLVSQIPLHHPLERRNLMSLKSLSAIERGHISTAVYRWQIWAGLFSQRACGRIQDQEPAAQIDADTQMAVFSARYTRWEQEQLACLYIYVHRRYAQLFNESARWFDQNRGPGPLDPAKEDLNPWWMLYADGLFAPRACSADCTCHCHES